MAIHGWSPAKKILWATLDGRTDGRIVLQLRDDGTDRGLPRGLLYAGLWSTEYGLRAMGYGLRTTDCGLRTADYGVRYVTSKVKWRSISIISFSAILFLDWTELDRTGLGWELDEA